MKFFVPDYTETRENDDALYDLAWKAQRHGHEGTEDPSDAEFWLVQLGDGGRRAALQDFSPDTSAIGFNAQKFEDGPVPAFVFEPRDEGYVYWTHHVEPADAATSGAARATYAENVAVESEDLAESFLDFLTDVLASKER